jgi:methylmalonyl-CoA mutase N-terminal domain/subunit
MPSALQNLWHAITAQSCQETNENKSAAWVYHISTAGEMFLIIGLSNCCSEK